jgi:hypothetical protein
MTPELCGTDQVLADIAQMLSTLSIAVPQFAPREVIVIGAGYGGSLAVFFQTEVPPVCDVRLGILCSCPILFIFI